MICKLDLHLITRCIYSVDEMHLFFFGNVIDGNDVELVSRSAALINQVCIIPTAFCILKTFWEYLALIPLSMEYLKHPWQPLAMKWYWCSPIYCLMLDLCNFVRYYLCPVHIVLKMHISASCNYFILNAFNWMAFLCHKNWKFLWIPSAGADQQCLAKCM